MLRIFLHLFALFWICLLVPPVQAQDQLSPAQRREVEALVREVIKKQPELVLEAIKTLREREDKADALRASEALKTERTALRASANDLVLGNPQGDVTIIEFFDYRCGYCKQAAPRIKEAIKGDAKLRVVMKELPILGPDSVIASRAAIASREQGKYAQFHDVLMNARGRLDETTVLQLATESGLDARRLKANMASAKVEEVIRANHELAEKLGISGTPAFIIGDKLIPGAIPLETIKTLVAEARRGCATC